MYYMSFKLVVHPHIHILKQISRSVGGSAHRAVQNLSGGACALDEVRQSQTEAVRTVGALWIYMFVFMFFVNILCERVRKELRMAICKSLHARQIADQSGYVLMYYHVPNTQVNAFGISVVELGFVRQRSCRGERLTMLLHDE